MADERIVPGRACETVRPLLPARARGDLSPGREDEVLSHARDCPVCRAALAETDPTALFLPLRRRPLPEGFWKEFDATLQARLAEERDAGWQAIPGWRPFRAWAGLGSALRPPRLAYFAAPLAMVLVLGVTLYVARPGLFVPVPRAPRPEAGLRSPYEPPVAPRRDAPGGRDASGPRPDRPLGAPLPAAFGARAAEPPPLEEVASLSARVYRLDVAGQDPTPIYMVVDESINF